MAGWQTERKCLESPKAARCRGASKAAVAPIRTLNNESQREQGIHVKMRCNKLLYPFWYIQNSWSLHVAFKPAKVMYRFPFCEEILWPGGNQLYYCTTSIPLVEWSVCCICKLVIQFPKLEANMKTRYLRRITVARQARHQCASHCQTPKQSASKCKTNRGQSMAERELLANGDQADDNQHTLKFLCFWTTVNKALNIGSWKKVGNNKLKRKREEKSWA